MLLTTPLKDVSRVTLWLHLNLEPMYAVQVWHQAIGSLKVTILSG
jgi:hypothetical protein